MSSADRGRNEVYAAERMAFEGTDLEEVERFEAVVRFAEQIVAHPWWPRGPVVFRPARRDARSSSARSRSAAGPAVIRLAAAQCTRATAVHELAHVLAGPGAGHGATFRRAHIDLAAHAFGTDRSAWLAQTYRDAGLVIGVRSWSAPPTTGSGAAIAL